MVDLSVEHRDYSVLSWGFDLELGGLRMSEKWDSSRLFRVCLFAGVGGIRRCPGDVSSWVKRELLAARERPRLGGAYTHC